MAGELVDFNPVSRITIGSVGPPGQRVFLLQANQGTAMITLKLEKEQAMVLASSVIELLEELDEKYPRLQSKFDKPLTSDLMLREPMEPAFVIGQIGLGYDQEQDLVVLVVQEIEFEGLEKPATARFWTTRAQIQALSDHTLEVASKGRPICPLCDSPMDPEGHFCPRSNGHEKPLWS
ncbi:MAG: DUF3090 family protein [Anaerolineales bacterium]|nr:DUF3090 family protein [Anaerolineales bacterium]